MLLGSSLRVSDRSDILDCHRGWLLDGGDVEASALLDIHWSILNLAMKVSTLSTILAWEKRTLNRNIHLIKQSINLQIKYDDRTGALAHQKFDERGMLVTWLFTCRDIKSSCLWHWNRPNFAQRIRNVLFNAITKEACKAGDLRAWSSTLAAVCRMAPIRLSSYFTSVLGSQLIDDPTAPSLWSSPLGNMIPFTKERSSGTLVARKLAIASYACISVSLRALQLIWMNA